MAITVGRAALSVSVPGEVRLELIEKPATTFPHPESGQPVAWRTRVVELRLGETVLDELPKSCVDRVAVLDEAEDVRRADVRSETFAMEPEHDLQDLVPPPQGRHGIRDCAYPFEEPVHVFERRVNRSANPRGQLRDQLVHLGGFTADDEDLGRQGPECFGDR